MGLLFKVAHTFDAVDATDNRPVHKRGASGRVVIPYRPSYDVPMARSLDRSTVEALYRRYGHQVERCCRRILRDDAEAADATHEVFIRLLTRGGEFRADAEWMTWLYQVATRLCLNRLRDEKNRRKILQRHGDPVKPRNAFPPSLLEDRNVLRMLLDSEDAQTQEIAVYRHVHGMTLQETAGMVGLSRPTVAERLKSFTKRAQALLQAKEEV